MNITLSIDERLVERAREKLHATGKTINQEIREHLADLAGDYDVERDIEEFLRLSKQAKPRAWKWNRDEIYAARLKWPRK